MLYCYFKKDDIVLFTVSVKTIIDLIITIIVFRKK